MISGLPPKSTPVRLNANDAPLIQRGLDSLYSPVDLLLAFLNGVFTGSGTSLGLALSTLTLTGALTAASVSSVSGFKSTLSYWQVWSSTYTTAQGAIPGNVAIVNSNGGGTAFVTWRWTATHPGSVIGISASQPGGTSGGPATISVLKNGVVFWSTTLAMGSGVTTVNPTAVKGRYPFVAGDILTTTVSASVNSNLQVVGFLTVELAA